MPGGLTRDYICPLSITVMKDPVIDCDGTNYEREAILSHLEKNNNAIISASGKIITAESLYPNKKLKETIEDATRVRVLMLGGLNTGKTSLLVRFTENRFVEKTVHTVCPVLIDPEPIVNLRTENGDLVRLEIYDTGGHERFMALTKSFYRNANFAIIVVNISTTEEFKYSKQQAENYLEQLNVNCGCPDYSVILVGNKSDLQSALPEIEKNKIMKDMNAMAEATKERLKSKTCFYVETSAKTGFNVNNVFLELSELAHEMEERKRSERSQNGSSIRGEERVGLIKLEETKSAKKGKSLWESISRCFLW